MIKPETVILDSQFVGRQNCLLSIGNSQSFARCVVLPDALHDLPLLDQFKLAAGESALHREGFEQAVKSAGLILQPHFSALSPKRRPVFLSYGSHASHILTALALKEARPGAILVSVNNPGLAAAAFDLIAVTPAEKITDNPQKAIQLNLIPNHISQTKLQIERQKWASRIVVNAPLVVVVVGGSVPLQVGSAEKAEFTVTQAEDFSREVAVFARQTGARLLVTNSFRTPRDVSKTIFAALKPHAAHMYDYHQPQGENPYLGYLSLATHAIVTADSMSMISDAVCAGLRPQIYLPPVGLLQERHQSFISNLLDKHYVTLLGRPSLNPALLAPENPSVRVARKIKKIIKGKVHADFLYGRNLGSPLTMEF